VKSKDERPSTAPLRMITNTTHRVLGGGVVVLLECGHEQRVRRTRGERTRCWKCLSLTRDAWDDAHRCPHGIVSEHPGERCERCTINILEARVARYSAALEKIADGPSDNWPQRVAREALEGE